MLLAELSFFGGGADQFFHRQQPADVQAFCGGDGFGRELQADLQALASRLTDASYRLSLVLGAPLPREVGAPRIISLPSAETGSP